MRIAHYFMQPKTITIQVNANKFSGGMKMLINKGVKIILRKRITEQYMLDGFEKLSNTKLPEPPTKEPKALHALASIWIFDLSKESTIKTYSELLNLFNLPYKTRNANKLFCKMIRYGWNDVMFEVHAWDDIYEQLLRSGNLFK